MGQILITGGAGFIGYHLATRLLEKASEIHLLDNYSRGVDDRFLQELLHNKGISFINEDLLNNKSLNHLNKNYTYIYHFAALIGVQHVLNAPYDVLVKNMHMLQNTLNFARKQKNLKRFVFPSTSEVYAGTLKNFRLTFPTPEDTPLSITDLSENRTSYMLSKIYGEAMCRHSGVPITIIRAHNFFGPRMGLSHAIPELLKKAYEAEEGVLDVYSIHHQRTFCYIEDAVEMILMLAENKLAIGETYNVGSQEGEISMGDLAKIIIEIVGKSLKINPLPPTPGSPRRRCPDTSKTQSIIDYKPQYTLHEGIKKTFDWYRPNIFDNLEATAI